MHYIYKITNLINNKIYIGQSKYPNKRWSQHKKESEKDFPSMIINSAMKKHGAINFLFEIIASCLDQDSANKSEEFIITQEQSHISYNKGYNVSLGGSVAPKSEEWKHAMRKRWADPVFKEMMSKSITEAHSQRTSEEKAETVAKIAQTKSNWTDEQKEEINSRIAATLTDALHSEERKNNISKGHLGQISWNKNTKGVMKANSGSFQIGHESYNKNISGITKNVFQPGHTINNGRKFPNRVSKSKGEFHSQVKLNNEKVLEIINLYQNKILNQSQLAEKFQVSRGTIKKIISGETWSHITNIKFGRT